MTETLAGTRLGPYELLERLGEGGMASVYRAYHPNMDRFVAVKIIRRWLEDDQAGLERFQREARVIARLEHPHILPVYDYNGTHQPPYIVMRLMSSSLKDALRAGPLASSEALSVLRQVASALDYAHEQGIIHRDLKPTNVMLDENGNAFLADFGLARPLGGLEITQSGYMIGTPGYMAPEQGMGAKEIGPAADIYSLGSMLFEMLAGQMAYQGESVMAVLMQQVQQPPPSLHQLNPDLPEALDAVIACAMAHDPARRYSTALQLVRDAAAALDIALSPGTGLTRPPAGLPGERVTRTPTPAGRSTYLLTASSERLSSAEQNRQVTVLYADSTEYERSLAEVLEPEEVETALKKLWDLVDTCILTPAGQGGLTVARTSSSLTLLWGAATTREDDPRRAILAAIAIRTATQPLADGDLLPLQIGITTGIAQLTSVTEPGPAASHTHRYTVSGPAIATVERLPAAVPDGGIAITQDTYRLVQGVFDIRPLPPLRVRGAREAIQAYEITTVKHRSLWVAPRGVEGIETRLVGRDAELHQVTDALEAAEEGEAQMITIVGEAGVGKTRLLYDFFLWIELREEGIFILRGRATPDMAAQPYALLRDTFAFRFEIQDGDSPSLVQAKMEQGANRFMGPGHEATAHFIGQLIGFDFSQSPYLQVALQDPVQFSEMALDCVVSFFHATANSPEAKLCVVELEDIQWADDPSLDLFVRLFRQYPTDPLLVVAAARPELLERRPDWSKGQPFHRLLDLMPLSKRESRKLVREVLQKIPDLPDSLRDWIVERAEGNPLYLEELVKMLMEERIIVKGTEPWQVDLDRLSDERVPPTLTGVLQARLDSLPPDERAVLQRAAAVGRTFWQGSLVALESADGLPIDVRAALTSLCQREMVTRREVASLGGSHEYSFLSNLLRDVAYETILKRLRKAYHAAAAGWLVETAGERLGEYAMAVAEHFELAGENLRAVEYLIRSAQAANLVNAYSQAVIALQRSLALTQDDPSEMARALRIATLVMLGEVYSLGTGEHSRAEGLLEEAVSLARGLGAAAGLAAALGQLGRIAYWRGDYPESKAYLSEALALARKLGDRSALVFVLRQLGNLGYATGDAEEASIHLEESLALARELDSKDAIIAALNTLGNIDGLLNDNATAITRYEEALAMAREVSSRRDEAMLLNNISDVYLRMRDYPPAATAAREALDIARQIGANAMVAASLNSLSLALLALRRIEEARAALTEDLRLAQSMGEAPIILLNLVGHAQLFGLTGQPERGFELLGLALAHPSFQEDDGFYVQDALAVLTPSLDPQAAAAAQARGAAMDLDQVILQLVQQQ